MKQLLVAMFIVVTATFCASAASAAIVTFDDLTGAGQLPGGYAGINWNNEWAYKYRDDSDTTQYTPHSGHQTVYNSTNGGATFLQDATFSFSAPVVFDGAWFAGYALTSVNFELYYQTTLVSTSSLLAPTATPTFLASGYAGLVDEVAVHDSGYHDVYDYYVMDDVTYTAVIPEPATAIIWSVLGALAIAVGWWRRRKPA